MFFLKFLARAGTLSKNTGLISLIFCGIFLRVQGVLPDLYGCHAGAAGYQGINAGSVGKGMIPGKNQECVYHSGTSIRLLACSTFAV
jgi:hypothetical protein